MRCEKCGQEFDSERDQYCPYCDVSLEETVEWSKKKKNDEKATFGWDNLAVAFILCITAPTLLLLLAAPRPLPTSELPTYIAGGAAFGFFLFASISGQQCRRCHQLFSMRRTKHSETGRKKMYEMRGNHQIVVLRVSYEDQFQCAKCGYEKKLVSYEDRTTFSE